MAAKEIDLYRAVQFLEGITDGADVAKTMHQVVRHFFVDKYKQNNPWHDVLDNRQKHYGDADRYSAAMQRFIQLTMKVLLERKALGGRDNAWTQPLLHCLFDLESDPTLYNDKWENPKGKHYPTIQKGCPQMFVVTRDSFLAHRGSVVIAQCIQRTISQMAQMENSLKQKQEAAKAADAGSDVRAQATKQADMIKKLRSTNIQSIMQDAKLLIETNKRIRMSLTPQMPAPAIVVDSDSDEDPSAPAEAVAPPAVVQVPGEDILPKVAAMIGDYIKRDAPRLLNDLDAVMKLLHKVYMGLQGGKDLTIDIWKVLALEALKGDVLVARIAALDKLFDLSQTWGEPEAFSAWVESEGIIPLVLGERMSADKDGYVKAARDLLQMTEFSRESFLPVLDGMILPKLKAELVQQHLIIDLCLQHAEFPAELWCIVLQRLEQLVKRADPAALALTRKLFTAEMIRKAIENQPEAVGQTLHFLRVTLDYWTAQAAEAPPSSGAMTEAEKRRAQLVFCYSEAWLCVGPSDAAENLRMPLSQKIASEVADVTGGGGPKCLPEQQPAPLELLKAQLDSLRPNVVKPDVLKPATRYTHGEVLPNKEQVEAEWRHAMIFAVERRDKFVATLNALAPSAGAEEQLPSSAAAAAAGFTLVDLLLQELVTYCSTCTDSEGPVDGARARLALVERMHRCCSTILLSESHLRTLLQLVEVDGDDSVGMEAMLFAWLRIAFSHAPPVKYDEPGQVSYPCFEPSAKATMLSYLEQMAARKAGGLSPQAFFLFQNLLVDINAASGAIRLRSFEGYTAAPYQFYTTSAARPANLPAATEIQLREVDRRVSSSRIVAMSNAGEFPVYGQAKLRPKNLDGPKMVGRWLKIRQEDANSEMEMTGVWKDGVLTRCIPGGWQTPHRFDIVYVDGSHTNNSLQNLHSWFLIEPLEEQLPLLPDIYHVDESILIGTDGLWRAAVSSADGDVARLAQKLLLKIECAVLEQGAARGSDTQQLHRVSSSGQSQLIQRVKTGLANALGEAEAGAVMAYVSVLQLFVDKYTSNATRRAHGSSVRGHPVELRVDVTSLPGVHSNTTAATIYAQVAAMRAAEPLDPDEMETGDSGEEAPVFILRHKGGELPRDSMQTLHELGIPHGCVMEAMEMRDEDEEGAAQHPKPCPGDALASDSGWLQLLLSLLASKQLPSKVGETVFALLNSIATFGAEIERINASGFQFPCSDGDSDDDTGFVRAAYTMQVLASQLRPARSCAAELAPEGVEDDGLSAWRAGPCVVSDLVDLVQFALTLPARCQQAEGTALSFTAAFTLPTVLDLIAACVDATCSDEDKTAADESDGVLSSLDDAGLATLKAALLGADGNGLALLNTIVALMAAGDELATLASAEVKAAGGKTAPAARPALKRVGRLATAVQRGADVLVMLLQQSPTLLQTFLDAPTHGLRAVSSLLFVSSNEGVKRGVRNALRGVAESSDAAGKAVFELCIQHWQASAPDATISAASTASKPQVDSAHFFGLLTDLQGTTPAIRGPLLSMFVQYLMNVPPATASGTAGSGDMEAADSQKSLVHVLELVASLLQSIVAANETGKATDSGTDRPSTASLAALAERLFTRFLFTIPVDGTDEGLPICATPPPRRAACAALDSLCQLDEQVQHWIVTELCNFVKVTEPPQSYTGFMDFNADMTDEYSTPYKLRNSTGRAGITNQGMTCYMNASLQQIFHIPEARQAVLDSVSGVRIQITNSADVLMRIPGTEQSPPALEIWINGQPLTKEGGGVTYNASTELSTPMAPGLFKISFRVLARGLDFAMEGIELRRSGNYVYELVGQTNDTFELRQKPKSSELLPQLRRCFYFLQEGNAATYDSSKLCDACEGMPMFAEWTENRVRQQCCAGEFFLNLMDAVSEGLKGLPCAASLKQVGTEWETTKYCHKCNTAYPDKTEWAPVNALTTFTEERKLRSLSECIDWECNPGTFDGKGDNPLLSPWCKVCGDKDDDERTVTSKWQAIKTPPKVLTVHLKRFNNVWDDWGGMRQEKKNHRIEFPLRFDLAPYMAENVRAKQVARIQAEMAAQTASGGEADASRSPTPGAADGGSVGTAGASDGTADGDAGEEDAGEPVWYSFLGAIIHSGVAGGGHYVSIVKQPDGRFVLFDDNEAIPFDVANIPDYCFGGEAEESAGGRGGARERTKNAYMLLYRREDASAEQQGEPEPEVVSETEQGQGGSAAVDAIAQAAMREMEEELQVENVRLLRRERMYQPAVIKLFYSMCKSYVDRLEMEKAADDAWREQYDGVSESAEEVRSTHTCLIRSIFNSMVAMTDVLGLPWWW